MNKSLKIGLILDGLYVSKYGEGISIRQISKLTEDSYNEEELVSYKSFYSSKILGSHHLHSNNKYTVFDIWKVMK